MLVRIHANNTATVPHARRWEYEAHQKQQEFFIFFEKMKREKKERNKNKQRTAKKKPLNNTAICSAFYECILE